MYESTNVANALLDAVRERGRQLSPLQLVKLVYISHGFSLALHGRPLIDQPVEAWRYGPVVAKVYHSAKKWGRGSIDGHLPTAATYFGGKNPDFDADTALIIKQVADKWGNLSGGALSSWTHKPGSPWAAIYREGKTGLQIPDTLIKSYFDGIVQANRARGAANG